MEDGAVGEWRVGEGQHQNGQSQDAEPEAFGAERPIDGDARVPHGWNEQERAPEDPAYPEEESAEQKRDRHEKGEAAMHAGREGVEDVSAIELACGHEVERSDEEADPSGDQDGMPDGQCKGRSGWIELRQEAVHHA